MTLFWLNGRVVDDQEGQVPEGATRVNTFKNLAQYGEQEFAWDPGNRYFSGNIAQNAPGYLTELLGRLDRQRAGEPLPWYEADEARQWEATARAMPTRDIAGLTSAWQGENRGGEWDEQGMWRPYDQDWWSRLDPGSPDAGPIMLALRDKIDQGTATPQERGLYDETLAKAQDWNWRASVPQASDAFNPLGDQLFGALGTLALGATGGLAAAPLAAGGAGLATTLGSLGTLSGIAGTGAGVLGQATDQEWLSKLGMGLGAAGGIAGGIGGLANLWGTGISSLGDVGRLASSAGRITGGIGTLSDSDVLRQAGGYLGAAGQLGSGVQTISDVFGSGVGNLTDAARLAGGLGQVGSAVGRVTGNRPLQQAAGFLGMGSRLGGNVGGLLGAAREAQQRGLQPQGPVQRTMADNDWLGQHWQPGPWQQPQPVLWNL